MQDTRKHTHTHHTLYHLFKTLLAQVFEICCTSLKMQMKIFWVKPVKFFEIHFQEIHEDCISVCLILRFFSFLISFASISFFLKFLIFSHIFSFSHCSPLAPPPFTFFVFSLSFYSFCSLNSFHFLSFYRLSPLSSFS